MAFAPRRHRRRRLRLIVVALVLTAVALLVNAGLSSGSKGPGKRLAGLAYVDQVRPLVQRSSQQGVDVAEVRGNAVQLGRNGIRRRMDRVRREAAADLRAMRRLDPPAGLVTDHSLLVSTMVLRARASAMIGDALVQAAGTGPTEPSVDRLVRAAEDLVTADRTYRAFVDLAAVDGAKSPLLPPSVWIPDPAVWTKPEVSAFVAALRTSAISTPVNDVSLLTFSTEPTPVATEAGSAVLPVVKTLRVEVVVANIGNEAQVGVPIVATLTGPAGEVDTARVFADLLPGQRRAMGIAGLRPVPGGPSILSVVVGPVEGESGLADNTATLSLVLRG